MTFESIITIVALAAAVILYSSSRISMTATSMMIVGVLYLTGIVDVNSLFTAYINSATLLVIFMFIISGALISSGASGMIGKWMLYGIKDEKHAMMRLTLITMLMSGFFSNMAACVIMSSFAVGMSQSNKEIRLPKLLMGVTFGALLGGSLTIIGVSGNVMVRTTLEEAGLGTVGFWEFGKIGVPMCIIGLLYMYFWGYRLSPEKSAAGAILPERKETDLDKRKCVISLSVFILVVIAMMMETVIRVPIQMSAFFGCVILLVTGTISEKEAFGYISWPGVTMFASLLTLGTAIAKTGTASMLANWLVSIMGADASPTMILTVLFVIIVILTQFMSNGATAAVFYPIGISLARQIHVSPVAVLMMICIAAGSSYATPMATPLNAYVMSIAGYKFSDFIKVGVPLLVITTIASIILCPMIWPV